MFHEASKKKQEKRMNNIFSDIWKSVNNIISFMREEYVQYSNERRWTFRENVTCVMAFLLILTIWSILDRHSVTNLSPTLIFGGFGFFLFKECSVRKFFVWDTSLKFFQVAVVKNSSPQEVLSHKSYLIHIYGACMCVAL